MRLGISHVLPHKTPADWARGLGALGLSAAVFPVDYTAPDAQIADYAAACREGGLLIAEVGAWSNPVSQDAAEREAALQKCVGQLRLAEELGARCCVNIAGAFGGTRWDGFHRLNYTEEAFEATVRSIQNIIDSVRPQHTTYCMEAMQWMIPDSPEQYLELMQRVDREAFAVHIDVTNWVYTPRSNLYSHEFIDHVFDLLGDGVRSCHLKDSKLHQGMTCLLEEVPVGLGDLDIAHYIRRADALSPDMPMIIEHLTGDQAYIEAVGRVKEIAAGAGAALK
jgi:sugar phosphate isomerase/epimerase